MTALPASGLAPRADAAQLLVRYRRSRRQEDLDALVRRYRPLARRLAARYARSSEPLDDLEQIANVGLVKAIQRFDPDRGYAFTSFAVPTMLGELKRSFRDTAWAARVPRALQEQVAEIHGVSDDFVARAGRAPSVAELGHLTGRDREQILDALGAAQAMTPVSLDAPRRMGEPDEEDGSLLATIGDRDDGYELVEDREAVRSAMAVLTDAQREMLALRFAHGLKQSEIARRVGVSQMQVSRTLRTALDTLSRVAAHQSQGRPVTSAR